MRFNGFLSQARARCLTEASGLLACVMAAGDGGGAGRQGRLPFVGPPAVL